MMYSIEGRVYMCVCVCVSLTVLLSGPINLMLLFPLFILLLMNHNHFRLITHLLDAIDITIATIITCRSNNNMSFLFPSSPLPFHLPFMGYDFLFLITYRTIIIVRTINNNRKTSAPTTPPATAATVLILPLIPNRITN